jgi:hypothetical protein
MHGAKTSRLVHTAFSNRAPMKNITGFLMDQNRQFDDAIHGLTYARDSLDGARYNPYCIHLNKLIYAFSGYEIMTFLLLWMFLPPVPIGVSPSLSRYGGVIVDTSCIEHVYRNLLCLLLASLTKTSRRFFLTLKFSPGTVYE